MTKNLERTLSGLCDSGWLSSPCGSEDVLRAFRRQNFPLSEFITRRMRKFFDLCIVDEAHEYKNDSARGDAARTIAAQSRRVLAMTGTMIGGYADDLPMLLSMVAPRALLDRGYSVGVKSPRGFGALYGATRVRQVDSRDGALLRSQTSAARQPGISPRAPLEFVAPRCCYLRMAEVKETNTEAVQKIISVPMGERLRAAYSQLEGSAIEYVRCHSTHIAAQVVQALITYTTTCWMPHVIRDPGFGGGIVLRARGVWRGRRENPEGGGSAEFVRIGN